MTAEITETNAAATPHRPKVPIVAIVGPPGAGKTELLESTIRELHGKVRIAIIAINPAADRDACRCARTCDQVEAVNTANPTQNAVAPALDRIDWQRTDIVFIESLGGIAGPPALGQDATVTVLSVTGGDDKAAEYAGLLAGSQLAILTKTDLRAHVPFDTNAFRADVRRINPRIELIETGLVGGPAMDRWINWLNTQRQLKDPACVAAPRREAAPTEWYFG